MNIYLIRHAEPNYETDNLTPRGLEQARRLGQYLSQIRFTHLYCSPHGRAVATLQAALPHQRAQPETLEWLRELAGRLPDNRWCWNFTLGDLIREPGRDKEIETFLSEQKRRLLESWDALLAEHGYRREGPLYHLPSADRRRPMIAIFCHAGLITTLLAGIFELPLAQTYCRLKCPPSSITHLRLTHYEDYGELRLISYAARPHLDIRDQMELEDNSYLG